MWRQVVFFFLHREASDFIILVQLLMVILIFRGFREKLLDRDSVLQGGCAKYVSIPLGAGFNYREHHRLSEIVTCCLCIVRPFNQY